MGHLSSSRTLGKTPHEWLPVGAQLGEIANIWAGRGDIIAYVGPGAGRGAPACFVPNLAEMEVDVNLAFTDGARPEFIGDLTDRDVQFSQPVAMGAVLHEAMHAKHSLWDLEDCANNVKDGFEHSLITSFEESRIEAKGLKKLPENRPFLRACILHLVAADLQEDKDFASRGHQAMSQLMLLTVARVDAGTLDKKDAKYISDVAVKLYGKKTVKKLRDIWLRAQVAGDDRWEPLHDLAREWIEILEDAGHDPRSESEVPDWLKEMLQEMVGDQADGEGGGGILIEMAGETETDARNDVNDQAGKEAAEAEAQARAETASQRNQHQKDADDIFGRGTGPGPAQTRSRLVNSRAPKGNERAAAITLARALENARYRDRVIEHRRSAVPPGRLNMRSVMAGQAELARGAQWSQLPWNGKRRYHTEDPNLEVGILTDISGSMRSVMESTAVTSWVLAEAIRRIQGQAAQVYYGNDVFATLAPGQHPDKVDIYSASDSTERFDKAFRALDGRLGLLGGHGARLLVVVSDLYHSPHERTAVRKWFTACRQDGVAVVVVAPDHRMVGNATEVVSGQGTVIRCDPSDPTALARLIGDAATRELRELSR